MPQIIVKSGPVAVKMPWVRRCHCGRRPDISTGYTGYDVGTGPFLIRCNCGRGDDWQKCTFSRSWTKTRAVRNWNRMIRENP